MVLFSKTTGGLGNTKLRYGLNSFWGGLKLPSLSQSILSVRTWHLLVVRGRCSCRTAAWIWSSGVEIPHIPWRTSGRHACFLHCWNWCDAAPGWWGQTSNNELVIMAASTVLSYVSQSYFTRNSQIDLEVLLWKYKYSANFVTYGKSVSYEYMYYRYYLAVKLHSCKHFHALTC